MLSKLQLSLIGLVIMFFNTTAQDRPDLLVSNIDSTLTKDANAVVRSEATNIKINSVNSVIISTKRIVTVLNKIGNRYADYSEGYDSSTKIRKLEAVIYDASGKEIKRFKKKDFIDRSVYDGVSLINDNRIKYLNYMPLEYPYTLSFESEVESKTTAFITPWYPVSGYEIGVQQSSYNVVNKTEIPLRIKDINFKNYDIQVKNTADSFSYSVADIKPKVPEVYSYSIYDMVPVLKVVPINFSLEGLKGSAVDWKSLGKWEYDNLIAGRDQLPKETIEEITQLVANTKTKREKAKLIYNYVQDKTRYISVQLGVGGFMPFLASDVDKWGYGDCKALTNYTKALLDSQGVESYYAELYSGHQKRNIDKEFASIEGDHVILNIPDKSGDIWLECTSQTLPFDFIGSFTDDRDVLLLTPEGGKIKRTKKYEISENISYTTAKVNLLSDKSMESEVKRITRGLKYYESYGIKDLEPEKQKLFYKRQWNYINGLEINKLTFLNDKDSIRFTEKIKVSSSSYGKKAGTRLLFTTNLFNRYQVDLPKYENRKTPLVISRGYIDKDEYLINIPNDYIINTLPGTISIKTEFGEYIFQLEKVDRGTIKLKRILKIFEGIFPKEKYEEYRKFKSEIKKADHTRIVLKKQ